MFERSIMRSLLRWKESDNRKPLVLRGARQTGKTTVVDMLGKEYANFIPLNLELERHRSIFQLDMPIRDLIDLLFARVGQVKRDGSTLIFIDEIQNSPQAMSKLRYFKEECPDIHVIAAGSLLENIVDVESSFPVGRVDFMALRPCSFAEFAQAIGKGHLLTFACSPELSATAHDELTALFNQYSIVGGMPEAVQRFAATRDVLAFDDVYESLLQGYKDDVAKYVKGGKLSDVVRFLIDRSWNYAGSIITLSNFSNSNYRSREVGESFRLLQKAMLLELVYPTTATMVPAMQEEKRMPKLLMLDTGLVNYKAGVRSELIGATDIMDVWRGRIAEQIVGQELLSLSDKVGAHRDFWVKGKDSAEVDFLYTYKSMLIPIEVKNGHNSHLRSLHSFIDKAPVNVGIRIWSQPFSVNDVVTAIGQKPFRLINLPFYMIHNLEAILQRYV